MTLKVRIELRQIKLLDSFTMALIFYLASLNKEFLTYKRDSFQQNLTKLAKKISKLSL